MVEEREREPFGTWLLAQKDRGDWVDSVADAARADRGFPRRGTPNDVRKRMNEIGANGDAFAAIDDAELDWMAY